MLFDSESAREQTLGFRKNYENGFKQMSMLKLRLIYSKR